MFHVCSCLNFPAFLFQLNYFWLGSSETSASVRHSKAVRLGAAVKMEDSNRKEFMKSEIVTVKGGKEKISDTSR
jgi:hypothetical protein